MVFRKEEKQKHTHTRARARELGQGNKLCERNDLTAVVFSPLVSGDFTFEVALLSEEKNRTIALLKKKKKKKGVGVTGAREQTA